jgi:membrane protease YdiL (CAAX protease family)
LPGGVNEGAAVWPTVLSLFAYSVVLTWVFVGTGGSVLLSALVHTGLNGVVPIMWGVDQETSWALRAVIAALIALAVVALGGYRRIADRT